MIETDSFIDSQTSTVRLLLLLFSPEYGMVSVLSVVLDFSSAIPNVETIIRHYESVESYRLTAYFLIGIINVALNVFMLFELSPKIKKHIVSVVRRIRLLASPAQRSLPQAEFNRDEFVIHDSSLEEAIFDFFDLVTVTSVPVITTTYLFPS